MNSNTEESNNLAERCPHLVEEWDYERNTPFKPENYRFASNDQVWWICRNNKNHRWIAEIDNRSRGQKCPWCFGNKPYHGKFLWIPYN